MPLTSNNQDRIYTYNDYLVWPEEERWEIIDGVPYMQATPSRIHQEISGELFRQISNYLIDKPCRVYAAPFSVRIPDGDEKDDDITTVLEPDITIVCDRTKLDEKGCKGAPDLIIEILSPSSGKKDRLVKFNKYEKAGVTEYWIVDPEDKLVSIFKLGVEKRFERIEVYSEEHSVKVGIFEGLTIDLKTVFSR